MTDFLTTQLAREELRLESNFDLQKVGLVPVGRSWNGSFKVTLYDRDAVFAKQRELGIKPSKHKYPWQP
jgi:hypothetical protein